MGALGQIQELEGIPMMGMVIRWRKTYIPHTVVEGLTSFNDAEEHVKKAMAINGIPASINLFEDHKHVASLRIMR